MDAKEAYYYAKNVVKGRCKECEKIILKINNKFDPHIQYRILYVKNIIKGRWDELEKSLLKSCDETENYMQPWYSCFHYIKKIIKNRWPEFEEKILKSTISLDNNDIINYCEKFVGGRWPELEKVLLEVEGVSLYSAIDYANLIIKERWKELEKKILNVPARLDSWWATDTKSALIFHYARDVIKGRWEEAEKNLLNNNICVQYATEIMKDRWKEAEEFIEKDRSFLQKRYNVFIKEKIYDLIDKKEYEKVLNYCDYKHFSRIIKNAERKYHIPDIIKNAMIANCLTGLDKESLQFVKQDKLFKKKMKNYLEEYRGILVDELIEKL